MSAKYQNVITEVLEVFCDGLSARVQGRFSFDLVKGVTAQAACQEIERRGKQVAALIRADQRLESMEFRNGDAWAEYAPSDRVARECAAGVQGGYGLGEASGDRWVGFELAAGVAITPEFVTGDRMGYGFRFVLHNFRTRFQVIPMLHACRDLPIAQLHVVSLVVLRSDRVRIAASVDSTAEQR